MREKPSRCGEPRDVDRVARAGDRARPERQLVDLVEQQREPRMIAAERGGVREKEVRDEDRLRAAQVRVGRHQRVAGALGAGRQDLHERDDRLLHRRHAALQVQPQIDRDLLVARPAGVQPAAGVADARDQLALDERVHVLVVLGRGRVEERLVAAVRQHLLEPRLDRGRIRWTEHAGARERLRPRQAAAHVVLEQPAIEPERPPELEQRRVGISLEPSGPEMRH